MARKLQQYSSATGTWHDVHTETIVADTYTGEVTSTGDGSTVVADNVIDEANLKLDEAPTDDYVLTADSTKTGGMKWAAGGNNVTVSATEPINPKINDVWIDIS